MAAEAAAGTGAEGIILKANSLRLGDYGLLIYGASGAGKSALSLALLERAALFGAAREAHRGTAGLAAKAAADRPYAALIADDYSRLYCRGRQIYAAAPHNIAGMIEIRGAGLFKTAYELSARLNLAVRLQGEGERYPQGHKWHWPAGEAAAQTEAKEREICLPLLHLPQSGAADIDSLCRAIEAALFKQADRLR